MNKYVITGTCIVDEPQTIVVTPEFAHDIFYALCGFNGCDVDAITSSTTNKGVTEYELLDDDGNIIASMETELSDNND